jgi:hypothetical protein
VGAIGGVEGQDGAPRPGDPFPLLSKNGDIGASKAIDGLLGVADDEQLATGSIRTRRQCFNVGAF